MKPCLIVNSNAGRTLTQQQLRGFAQRDGVRILDEPSRPLNESLHAACEDGCRRFIVAGGDGTLARVVNEMVDRLGEVELAILPAGTGNDLARSLGIFGAPREDAWDWAVHRPAVDIDLIRVINGESRYLINVATAGFGGMVSQDVTSDEKRRWGALAYWMTAFAKLGELEEFQVKIELDDQKLALSTFGLAVANGRYVGGGFPVAPNAMVNDGLLTVTTVPVLPPLELLAAGVDFLLGRQHQGKRVRTYQSTRVVIRAEPRLLYSLDGEPNHAIEATFEVMPRAARIVCGPEPPAVHTDSDVGQSDR